MLEELRGRGLKLGLVSNTSRDLEAFVVHHRLEVDVAIGSRSHGKTKPDPTIFRAALDRLAVEPAAAAMVGDSVEDDIEGALALGMRAILLDREGRYPELEPRITGLARADGGARPLDPELLPPGRRVLAERGRAALDGRAELRRRLLERRTGPTQTSSPSKSSSHSASGRDASSAASSGSSGSNARPAHSSWPEHLAEALPEARLERGHGEEAAVGRRVGAIAGDAAGEQAGHGVAAEAVGDEPVRAVRHRDDEVAAEAGALPLEQGGQDLGDRRQRARREVGDLHGRRRRGRVGERARPAEVVEVVADALLVRPAEAEAGERAPDRPLGPLEPEPGRDSRAEALDTTSARATSARPSCGSALRSHTTDSLPALSAASHAGAAAQSDRPPAARAAPRARRAARARASRTARAGAG